jgi:hypothetical protein
MYYSGFAYGVDKNYDVEHEKAKEKLKGLEYERISSSSCSGQYHYTIKFKDVNAPVTEQDVIYGITNMCFGGCCSKIEPGVFKIMEYTD